ncbi:MAG: DMT family transporter [Pseudonocardia sp.]|nr:DMT family transporter [Pseudonocardia sp.]
MLIAVPAAVLAAASFGLSGALQQRATKRTRSRALLDPRLVIELVRQPQWLIGTSAVVAGLALQVVALAFGPLVLVQPLLATSILFAGATASWLASRRLDTGVVAGAGTCITGLAVFLVLASPSDPVEQTDGITHPSPLAIVLASVVIGFIAVAAIARFTGRVGAELHVAALALATGVIYGTTAGLIKVITGEIRRDGPLSVFAHPTLYVVCLIGPVGFLLSQQTFKQGTLIAPALAVISIVDPLVAITIGVTWLGERVDTAPTALAGQAVGLVVLAAGMAVLAQRDVSFRRSSERAAGRTTADPHPAATRPSPH